MGALWAILGGVIAIFLGILGLIKWWVLFLKGLAATVPALLIFGGCIATFIGFTEIRDSLKSKEEDDFTSYSPASRIEEEKEAEKCSKTDTEKKSKKEEKQE